MDRKRYMAIRLIALDVDGTVVGDTLHVPERVKAAVHAAQARGIYVTLATGRSYAGTQSVAQQLHITAPLILYQGSVVAEPETGRALFRVGMPHDLMIEAVDLARAHGWHVALYDDDRAYIERQIESPEFYARMIHPDTRVVGDLYEVVNGRAIKFLFMDAPAGIPAIEAALRAYFGDRAVIVRSHPQFVEGNPAGVSKGRALEWLAGYLGVAREEVLAVGDSDNDAPMLAWAGMSVAMEGASPAAREAARWIAPPFAEDGAAQAIERFALGTQP